MNTTALTDCFGSVFFSSFAFLGFAVSGFLGVFFWEEWKTNKDKIKNKTKNKADHKMQTTKPLSPDFFKRRNQTTQTQHNTNKMSKMETNNTREKQNKNKHMKLQNYKTTL